MNPVFRHLAYLIVALTLSSGFASGVGAAVITQFTSGTTSATNGFFGQSFTTPLGNSHNNINFNFFSDVSGGTTPSGAGTLFLLTQEYLGTPSALSAATPGFLASSIGVSGGVFSFAPSVILDDATQYFAYANTAFLVSGSNTGGFPGGNAYVAFTSATNFVAFGGDANFRVSGTPLAAPEPATLALVGLAFAGLGFARRRRE